MKTLEPTEFSVNSNMDIEENVFKNLKGLKDSKQKDGKYECNPVIALKGKNPTIELLLT